jgi:hypothetical protein
MTIESLQGLPPVPVLQQSNLTQKPEATVGDSYLCQSLLSSPLFHENVAL